MLNFEMFRYFDHAISQRNAYKVETIGKRGLKMFKQQILFAGDAYMVRFIVSKNKMIKRSKQHKIIYDFDL